MLHVTQRKELYALFAQLFSYPDAQLAETLAEPATCLLTDHLGGPLPTVPADATLLELQVAYTSLFVNRLGGVPAPPYGSVYLEAGEQLMGATTQRVATWYAAQGLRIDGVTEPVDFLATELEFLYFLVEREEAALAQPDLAAARAATLDQARFGADLFFPWVATFCQRVAGAAEVHPFYRQAAVLLERFCIAEQAWLSKLHPAPEPG